MKFKIFFLALLLSVLIQYSCSDELVINDLPLNQEVILPYQETLGLESTNLSITLDSIEESRCPYTMDCAWAGMVKVYLNVASLGSSHNFSLCHSPDVSIVCDNYIEIGNYSYQLVAVNPYPESLTIVTFEDYEASLIISEL